jgi:hypothetical protein
MPTPSALARAWLRVIWRCCTDNVPYDPDRHAAAVAARQARDQHPTQTGTAGAVPTAAVA